MTTSDDAMVTIHGGPTPTVEIELERATVTAEQVRRFLGSAAPDAAGEPLAISAPLTFALALRRAHGPEAAISPGAFAIHGGHDIVSHTPIAVGETYVVSGRVERVFTKTGRSGPLTIVERQVWIRDLSGRTATEIADRQIVRWRPREAAAPTAPPPADRGPSPAHGNPDIAGPLTATSLEIGESLGPYHRRGPSAREISNWADALRDREVLFHDRTNARALGYRDLVVPGPMQSAFVDHWLTKLTSPWRPTRLHMTFRQSLLAGEPLLIEGVVTDADQDERSLDLTIRNAACGETTSTGTAVLHRNR